MFERGTTLRPRRIINRPAFLVHTAEIANHYAPVWKELKDHPFDVLLSPGVTLPSQISLKGLPVRIRSVRTALLLGERYKVLVSNHYQGYHDGKVRVPLTSFRIPFRKPAPAIKMLGVQNIRMLYAAGKLGWNMSDWNALYDGILCFGPRHASLFKEKFGLPVFEMGYPRFDNYFNVPIDKASVIASLGGNPDQKTIIWLPTWKKLSSVGHFNTEIADLVKSFNVIVKVHPLMVHDEPHRVNELSKLGLTAIIQDARDNIPLYQVADTMLFDYGGPPFGGIYTRKRFVLLNVPGASNDPWAGPDSSDIALRDVFRNVDPGSGKLQRLVEDDESWVEHDDACRTLSDVYFAPLQGTSAAAAAAAIRDRSWIDDTKS